VTPENSVAVREASELLNHSLMALGIRNNRFESIGELRGRPIHELAEQ
jgi:hypothetical protein